MLFCLCVCVYVFPFSGCMPIETSWHYKAVFVYTSFIAVRESICSISESILFLQVVETFTEAAKTIDPARASGRLFKLWLEFAKFFESDCKDEEGARQVLEKAILAPFRSVDDLAILWCEYAEFELRHKQHLRALEVMQRATALPPNRARSIYDVGNVYLNLLSFPLGVQ